MASKRPSRRPPSGAGKRTISIASGATALTIAGSDPSGGAGLQADLKTFQQLGVYGMSAVTLITVQNTCEVRQVSVLDPDLVIAQLNAVLEDIPPRAIKLGALGSPSMVRRIAERLRDLDCPIIVDPVLVSKHGHPLADDATVDAYRESLLPLATLITPNRHEAERLTGVRLHDVGDPVKVLTAFDRLGVKHTLLKAGRLKTGTHADMAVNWLSHNSQGQQRMNYVKIGTDWLAQGNTHGSGCVLSATITGLFSLGETDVDEVAKRAISLTYSAIAIQCELGLGIHPAETRALPLFGGID